MTAQGDNATLKALLRATVAGLVDFARIIVMRTARDMDRPYPGQATDEPVLDEPGRFRARAAEYLSGRIKVVQGIWGEWNSTFAAGVNATNYIRDIFGTLGGTPYFGPGSDFNDNPVVLKKRGAGGMKRSPVGTKESAKGKRNVDVRLGGYEVEKKGLGFG